jgi:hypothetical protein
MVCWVDFYLLMGAGSILYILGLDYQQADVTRHELGLMPYVSMTMLCSRKTREQASENTMLDAFMDRGLVY